MKNEFLTTLCIAAILLSGCKGKKDSGEEQKDTNLARQEYSTEKNPVTVMTLEKREFRKELISNGKLEARSRSTLAFRTSGTVAAINVRDGESVSRGAILATLDDNDARSSLESAELSYRKAEITLADKLLDYGYTISDTTTMPRDIRNAVYISSGFADAKIAHTKALRALDACTLKAPFSGKVADIKMKPYQPASGELCTLIDDQVMNVRFSVLETEFGFVHVGQQVRIAPFNDEHNVRNGKIVTINPTVDKNGQIAVTAQVQGAPGLLDGMNVKIIIENVIKDKLVVPKSAVVIRDNMEVLFRYVDGRSLWTYVNIMMSNTSEHVVEPNISRGADLNVGDIIITSGNLNLGGDTPVEIIK